MMEWTTLGYLTERVSALFIIMAVVTCRGKSRFVFKRQREFPGNSQDSFGRS